MYQQKIVSLGKSWKHTLKVQTYPNLFTFSKCSSGFVTSFRYLLRLPTSWKNCWDGVVFKNGSSRHVKWVVYPGFEARRLYIYNFFAKVICILYCLPHYRVQRFVYSYVFNKEIELKSYSMLSAELFTSCYFKHSLHFYQ